MDTFKRKYLNVSRLQNLLVTILVDVMALLVLVMLIWAVVGAARDVWNAIAMGSTEAFKELSVELLTVFIFIELFHSLTEYMRYRRIRITTLVDASLAFVLREVWVAMYGGETSWQKLLALSFMVLALGAVRTLAIVRSPSANEQDASAEAEL